MKLAKILGLVALPALCSGKIVFTSSGPVRGHKASVENVSAYLGIPYAVAPIGKLRFQPPVPFRGILPINAKAIRSACPSVTFFSARNNDIYQYNVTYANLTAQGFLTEVDLLQATDTFSEDCLHVNVWVPKGGAKRKAVMIWIFGGSFTSGSTQIGYYDGQHLAAEQDVIVVTLNYRLNILGFNGDPEAKIRNPGFLDQRLAVEWVRNNIKGFGGDKERMILFGQSAGAASVDSYSYAYADDPIVKGFILQSGVAAWGKKLPINKAKEWYEVSSSLGCGTNETATSSEILSCMQEKDVWKLLHSMGTNAFTPTADGITAFSDYAALAAAGKSAQLPVLIGSNEFEGGTYVVSDALYGRTNSHEHYVGITNKTFGCPVGQRANMTVAQRLPIWRYRYFGDFPNTRLFLNLDSPNPDSGAWHCAEIGIIWHTLPTGPGIPPDTPEEVSLRKYIQGAWGAFAKDPQNALLAYEDGWPRYNPFEKTLIRLAYDNITGTNLEHPQVYDESCTTTYPVPNPDRYTFVLEPDKVEL